MIDADCYALLMAAAHAETPDEIGHLAARLFREVPSDDPDRAAIGEALARYHDRLGPTEGASASA